jgi:hypothetical protein
MSIKVRLVAAGLGLALAMIIGLSTVAQARVEADEAIARLESRAETLQRERVGSPKKGQVQHARLREQLREITGEIARIESGGAVDAERLARLTGAGGSEQLDDEALARRAVARQEAMERRLTTGPKLGVLGRQAAREDLERLDRVIAALESGRDVDPDELSDALGMMIADASRSPQERRRESEMRLAAMKRKLTAGPKLGSLGRERVQAEIEALDAMIDRLESKVGR